MVLPVGYPPGHLVGKTDATPVLRSISKNPVLWTLQHNLRTLQELCTWQGRQVKVVEKCYLDAAGMTRSPVTS